MQAHKQALNKFLTTRDEWEYFYMNEMGTGYISNQTYKHGNGSLTLKNPRVVKYGVGGPGFPDLVGFTRVRIEQSMVGEELPIFSTVEMKCPGDRLRPEQKKWNTILRDLGCLTKVLLYNDGEFTELDF